MGVEQLTNSLHRLLLGQFQAYVWRDADGVTLIDTGAADTGGELASALDELGLAPSDIDRIVLTHAHDDHFGAAAEIRDWGPVEIVAHRADAPVIRGETPVPRPQLSAEERELAARLSAGVPPAPPVPVDREVVEGAVLDFGGGAQVLEVPGHTAGSIALYLPEHRLVFTGDIAVEHLGRVMVGIINMDPVRAVESLQRLAGLDVDVALFGHGQPVLHGAAALLGQAVQAAHAARAGEWL